MLRKDREVLDLDEICAILARCDTLRLGLGGGEYPYVVPVSFGMTRDGGEVSVYFHGAAAGQKAKLLAAEPRVCVEADVFYRAEVTENGGITARYESVIGFGTAEAVRGDEAVRGLRAIVEHYGFGDYPVERCGSLGATAVYRVRLRELSGKRNRPREG